MFYPRLFILFCCYTSLTVPTLQILEKSVITLLSSHSMAQSPSLWLLFILGTSHLLCNSFRILRDCFSNPRLIYWKSRFSFTSMSVPVTKVDSMICWYKMFSCTTYSRTLSPHVLSLPRGSKFVQSISIWLKSPEYSNFFHHFQLPTLSWMRFYDSLCFSSEFLGGFFFSSTGLLGLLIPIFPKISLSKATMDYHNFLRIDGKGFYL